MRRLGRYLEGIAYFEYAGRLTLYGKLETTFPGAGPSACDKIFRVTPPLAAGGAPWADAAVATNSVIPQIAHDAKPANPRRVSMTPSLPSV
jgi:hypothetical protein